VFKTSRRGALRFLKLHFGVWWKHYVALLGVLYLFYKIAGPLGDLLTSWLLRHEPVLNGAVSVDKVATGVLVACFLLLIGLIVFSVFTTVELMRKQRQVNETLKASILLKTFERSVQAADLIAKQLFPGTASAIKKVISCKQVYTLFKNGDCHASETLVVMAKDRDIHFMEKFIAADDEGEPVDFPDEIDLKVASVTPNRGVAYLITANEKRRKHVMVFFLPRIHAAAPDQREIRITYYWKGFFKRLVTHGEEPFETTIKSVEPIPQVEYEFLVAPDAGDLTCVNVGQLIDENDPQR
jgi:hypothetical protein